MRITCQDIHEFLECIEAERPSVCKNILQNTIRISRIRKPIDGEVKFLISIQASTVINLPDDEGQYLLEVGEECGIDYEDASKDMAGSRRATELREMIVEFCRKHGLSVLPGIIDM